MRPVTLILILVQALLTEAALVLSIWSGMPRLATAGLGLLGFSALAAANARLGAWRQRLRLVGMAVAWAGLLLVAASVVVGKEARATVGTYFNGYYVALAWIMAAAILPASRAGLREALGAQWKGLAMIWLMLGALLWLGAAYSRDETGAFYLGLLIFLALLILCHTWLRLNTPGILVVNTLILLVVGLPLADLVVRGADWVRATPDASKQYYLYSAARKDPVAFGRWWNYYLTQWRRVEKRICIRDRDAILLYRLRPNSHARLAQSTISINSLGFRGRDFPRRKGNAYRIVALGESTTFGITLTADDQPWPARLEEMIRERLKLHRPVEVINAGVPGYRLDQNLHRLRTEILPLKPDMIISYHGINGFGMLKSALPPFIGARLPAYQERPVQLLADVEYRLRLFGFQHSPAPEPSRLPRPLADPMVTPYAKLYRQLVRIAATNHIRLVLATYSMALNDRSSPDLVKFYEAGYPRAAWQVQANVLHSAIVRQIAAQNPEVCLVDTHPHLDGEHDKFIDLVHLDPAGHQQLAETFFVALKPILQADLSRF
jgi:lysophospholipase L1-like esterase